MILKKVSVIQLLIAILFWLGLPGLVAADPRVANLVSFGSGSIDVRIYSDYFCPPCQATEPLIEPVLKDLLKKRIIRLTMVDTPFNRSTPMYARYFLYALRRDAGDVEQAFQVRKILVEAARKSLSAPEQLETLFNEQRIPFTVFDVKPVFEGLNALIRGDGISATPTAVIIRDGKKVAYVGGNEILKALQALQ